MTPAASASERTDTEDVWRPGWAFPRLSRKGGVIAHYFPAGSARSACGLTSYFGLGRLSSPPLRACMRCRDVHNRQATP